MCAGDYFGVAALVLYAHPYPVIADLTSRGNGKVDCPVLPGASVPGRNILVPSDQVLCAAVRIRPRAIGVTVEIVSEVNAECFIVIGIPRHVVE